MSLSVYGDLCSLNSLSSYKHVGFEELYHSGLIGSKSLLPHKLGVCHIRLGRPPRMVGCGRYACSELRRWMQRIEV